MMNKKSIAALAGALSLSLTVSGQAVAKDTHAAPRAAKAKVAVKAKKVTQAARPAALNFTPKAKPKAAEATCAGKAGEAGCGGAHKKSSEGSCGG